MAERGKLTHLPGAHSHVAAIPAIATAGDTQEAVVWVNNTGARVRITQASFTPDAALTGAATNNLSLQFRNKELGGLGVVAVTAVKTYDNGVDILAHDEDALVLSTTAANLIIEPSEVVALNKANNGTGLALPAGVASLKYEFTA